MIRLIVLVVALAIVVWALLRTLARVRPFFQAINEIRAGATNPVQKKERFVACARCGVHVPESRSVLASGSSGEAYCSTGCLELTDG